MSTNNENPYVPLWINRPNKAYQNALEGTFINLDESPQVDQLEESPADIEEVEESKDPPEWALNLEVIFKDLGMDTRVEPEVYYKELALFPTTSNEFPSNQFPPFVSVYRNISFFAYGREDINVNEFESSQKLNAGNPNQHQMPTLLGRIRKPERSGIGSEGYQCALTQMYVRPNEINFQVLSGDNKWMIIKDAWNSSQSIPVIVNGSLVANLYCIPSGRFVLTMYTPNGVVSGYIDSWETIPLVEWPKDVVRSMLKRVEQLINVYIRKDLFNQSSYKIQQVLLTEIYYDEHFDDLTHYFQISHEVDIAEMRLIKTRNSIANHECRFTAVQSTISDLISSLSESRLLKKAIENLPEENKIFNAVDNDRITYWYELDNILYFYTDDIYLVPLYVGSELEGEMNDDGSISIGCYCIQIDLNGEIDVESIKLMAINGGVNAMESGMQHPHVFPSGNACFGTYLNTVMDTLADFDIQTLLDVLIAFLSACDPDDTAGKYWVRWIDEDYDPDMNN